MPFFQDFTDTFDRFGWDYTPTSRESDIYSVYSLEKLRFLFSLWPASVCKSFYYKTINNKKGLSLTLSQQIHRSSAEGPCKKQLLSPRPLAVSDNWSRCVNCPSVCPPVSRGELKIKAVTWHGSCAFAPVSKNCGYIFSHASVWFNRQPIPRIGTCTPAWLKEHTRRHRRRHRAMSADSRSRSNRKAKDDFVSVFSPILNPPQSPTPTPLHPRCPFIGPEWHHDLKLKWAIKPSLMPRQKKIKICLHISASLCSFYTIS